MTVQLEPALEAQLNERALRDGIPAEDLVISAVQKLLGDLDDFVPQDEWERGLFSIRRNYGVTLSDYALSSEGMYADVISY